MLELWTTSAHVGIISNMKAVQLVRTRIAYSETAFAKLVLWQIPNPLTGRKHRFKYRLAYVVHGLCLLRSDNEDGKGDHRHVGDKESPCKFTTPDRLVADFQRDIARWNNENRNS